MSEWISINDRLPDDHALVVASRHYGYGQMPDAAVCLFLHGEFSLHDDCITEENYDGGAVPKLDMNVTHWMPLPEPPEGL